MGAVLILTGIVGAAITSPIFDRYLTHHLSLAVKVLIPLLAASYIALIWDGMDPFHTFLLPRKSEC